MAPRPAWRCAPEVGPRCAHLLSSLSVQDEYCTLRVEDVLDSLGWAGCSARADAGTTPRHEELERLIAEFLVGGWLAVWSMLCGLQATRCGNRHGAQLTVCRPWFGAPGCCRRMRAGRLAALGSAAATPAWFLTLLTARRSAGRSGLLLPHATCHPLPPIASLVQRRPDACRRARRRRSPAAWALPPTRPSSLCWRARARSWSATRSTTPPLWRGSGAPVSDRRAKNALQARCSAASRHSRLRPQGWQRAAAWQRRGVPHVHQQCAAATPLDKPRCSVAHCRESARPCCSAVVLAVLAAPAKVTLAKPPARPAWPHLPAACLPACLACLPAGAKVKVFDHNEPAHLEAVLRAAIAEGQPRTGRPWKKIVSAGSGARPACAGAR